MNHLALHATRLVITGGLLAGAIWVDRPGLTAGVTVLWFLGAFSMQHDLIHAALKLPGRLRRVLLSTLGSTMLMSGHATRHNHLLHHRATFGPGDLEGATARMTRWETLRACLPLTWRMRVVPLRTAAPSVRRRVAAEYAVNLACGVALALSGPHGVFILMTFIALNLSMPIWAGRIPHRAPDFAEPLARKLAFTRSPTILSFGYHDLHHDFPRVPCQELAAFAARQARDRSAPLPLFSRP